ncbi:MAG: helix-turn-helix transcriptional regulator [Alphaproteobacteria bacterium]|nr:helix-turn-helix transcriptional regulator [Alphaproteobacteria bacterium]
MTSTAQRAAPAHVGEHLREWRQRRRLSQLEFAGEADISTRHLSFIETGRARPSREMLLHLAERLEIPLRERNTVLVAAGFAPVFSEKSLDDPALSAARAAIDLVLKGHEPFPALAVDRHWNIVSMNSAVAIFMEGVDADLLETPPNAVRLGMHPSGMARHIVNGAEWRAHILSRLRRQVEMSADTVLAALYAEVSAYPAPIGARPAQPDHGVFIPLKLKTSKGVLSFLSTMTMFGTPMDVTLSELALEAFYPADEETARALRG